MLLFLVSIIGIPSLVYAQNFEEEFEQFSNDIKSEFELFQEQNIKAFNDFLINSEKEFMHLLREEWIDVKNSGINRRDVVNKPDTITTFNKIGSSGGSDRYKIDNVRKKAGLERNGIGSYVFQLEKDDKREYVDIELNLFGESKNISIDKSVLNVNLQEINSRAIASNYEKMIHADYNYLLKQLTDINKQLNGNDWMLYQIIEHTSRLISTGSFNKKTFLTWYLMLKAGYKVRLGISGNNKLVLLISTLQKVYNSPHYNLDYTTYYALHENPVQLKTYRHGMAGGRTIDLKIKNSLILNERITTKAVKFKFENKTYNFDIQVNKNLVDFYRTYPTTELNIYQSAPLSYSVVKTLRNEVSPIIQNMNKDHAQQFVLSLVQHGFSYLNDFILHGKEHFNFSEETLWENSSDCEDRAVLLSALYEELLGLKTTLLDYKGHVVVGLPEEQSIEGVTQCIINNRLYTLADPSYLNAPVGIISPSLKDVKPQLLSILEQEDKTVQLSSDCIIEKSYSLNDSTNILIVGFFDTCLIQNYLIHPQNREYETMVVSQNSKAGNEWFLKPEGTYSIQDMAIGVKSIIVVGIFEGFLKFRDKEIHSDSSGIFMLELNENGNINWIRKVEFNKKMFESTQHTMVFDSLGKVLFTLPAEIDLPQQQVSIYTDSKENIYLNILSDALKKPLMDSVSFETGDVFDIVNWIVMENSRLLKANFHIETAPIFALVNLLYSGNITLKGTHLVDILKSSTTKNLKRREELVANLMDIRQITRNYDVVKVTTGSEKPIQINNLLVADKTIAKVVQQSKGSRIFIYRGVEVNMDDNTHKLNNIFINQFTGEIWYDYDKGYRSKLPVRNIIMN